MHSAPPACALLLLVALAGRCRAAVGSGGGGGSCPAEDDDVAGLAQLRARQLQRRAPPAPEPECAILSKNAHIVPASESDACVNLIKGPALRAKEHMEGLIRFYRSFYAFTAIASDPPAANYSFDPPFTDLGIFGGENGGNPANLSKVDLLGDWQEVADAIPAEGTYPVNKWIAPATGAFNKLRDCHPDMWGGCEDPTRNYCHVFPVLLLTSIFSLQLTDMASLKAVSVEVSAADQENAIVDGTLKPIVKDRESGSVIKSIGQQPAMEWLVQNIAMSPTFGADVNFCAKSLGGRMNQVVKFLNSQGELGVSWPLGILGPLDDLSPGNISVELEGGDSAVWSWNVVLGESLPFDCPDFACVVDAAPAFLNKSGGYYDVVKTATNAMNESFDNNALSMLSRESPPRKEPHSLLDAAPSSTSQPDDVFAWLMEPTKTYGYFAFRNRSDGTEFGLLKYATFDRQVDPMWDFEHYPVLMAETWRNFTSEAKRRGVTRLLVDVVGNGGGTTAYAWQFVQMMMPELTYRQTCGSVNRPIPKAYDLWSEINLLPIEQYMMKEDPGPGFQQDRVNQLAADPALAEAVANNTKLILELISTLGRADDNTFTEVVEEALNGTSGSVEELIQSLLKLYGEGQCANPFATDAFRSFDDIRRGESTPESQFDTAYQHPDLQRRGTYTRNFTARTYDCPPNPPAEDGAHPFDDIVFVSDGTCGSSCYLAVGTTWAIAKAWSNTSVRTATWGGVGGSIEEAKKTLSPTAFPGGNVQRDQDVSINGIFACLLLQFGVASAIGAVGDLAGQLSAVWNEMASLVSYYSLRAPGFTQSEVYQPAFGERAPPAEYVFTPTDLFLPAYFSDVSGTDASKWNLTQLDAMHQLAALAFN